jgi:chromosome segregation ATPase
MFIKLALILLAAVGDSQAELEKIDRQISQLEEMQERLRSDAQKNEHRGMSLQFQKESSHEARKAWQRAAQEKQKIEEIQGHLDRLRARKQQILQEHGQK